MQYAEQFYIELEFLLAFGIQPPLPVHQFYGTIFPKINIFIHFKLPRKFGKISFFSILQFTRNKFFIAKIKLFRVQEI